METAPELLDVVALVSDCPSHGLVRGQAGTVVEVLADDAFEVEFCDDEGRTYATKGFRADRLMVLHHRPVRVA